MDGCKYYYHFSCIENYSVEVGDDKNNFTCPLHRCISCHADSIIYNETRDSIKKPLVTCVGCPIAYHSSLQCIGAGSVRLSSNLIICPNHYHKGQLLKKSERLVNVNYCFNCNEGKICNCFVHSLRMFII